MPATEETYYRQPTMHIVFGISSIAMLLAIVWMIMADHLRPWKEVQREFHQVEKAKLEATRAKALEDQKSRFQNQINEIDAKIQKADETAEERSSEIRRIDKEIRTLGGRFEELDTKKRFMKAELDSKRSFYDGMIDRGEEREARNYLEGTIANADKELVEVSKANENAKAALGKLKAKREELLGFVDNLTKERERLTRDYDRANRVLQQKDAQYFGLTAWLRGLPGFDIVPPTKIQQISLPDLTINYNFKDVPRYDRCTTCHQGIDRINYDKDAQNQPMPTVFASHPHLTDGATAIDPRGKVVPAGIYLDANGPHPINSFGCTICHGGQGSGTDFTYSSHTPNDPKQKEEWAQPPLNWREIHHWDEPMLPSRFMESSCVKCHHEVTDIPRATKLQAGYERVVKYGCSGCHQIGGPGSFGPDLTDEHPVGPNLGHVGSKVSKEWIVKWIKNPHAFRPDTRMPRFYGVTNNDAPRDQPKSDAEIHAIAHYLFAKTTPTQGYVEPATKGDPVKGKELFLVKGCLACHAHKPYSASDVQLSDKNKLNPKYKPEKTFDPSMFPEAVRKYAQASFGPNLSNVAAKFQSRDQGHKWLANWIRTPEAYHPKTLMPNLQLSAEDASDLAAWILTIPGEWPVDVRVSAADSKEVLEATDELVSLYVSKAGGFNLGDRKESKSLSEVDDFVKNKLSREDKMMYLGEKTISRLGCFGCHKIPGFENAKPIGTSLNGWGVKAPSKLDFAHIAEYIEDQPADDHGARDGTDSFYQEKLLDHTRTGFLYQKLHRPRSYDYKKTSEDMKTWDERLRMPQFAFANDPKAVEEVMTFILGLTGEKIASKYLPKSHYTPRQNALARGERLLNRYNCAGCHVLEMPQYTVAAGSKLEDTITGFKSNLRSSYQNRASDFLKEFYPGLTYDEKTPLDPDKIEAALGLKPEDGTAVVLEGMPIGVFENELTVQLWKPVTIRGYTFNVGDTLTLDKSKVSVKDPVGGNFAWLYATYQSERTGGEFATLWNRLPPPLLREGKKVQTPWITSFLNDPYPIRPAVNLRMPRFNFGKAGDSPLEETAGLANHFAARDNTEFPYQAIEERTQRYLASREQAHPQYLSAGWTMMTAKPSPCTSCHAIGSYKPTGGEKVVNGPDLRQVGTRFRPDFLAEWVAKPSRLVPFTAMPQNVVPKGPAQLPVPKTFEDKPFEMVKGIRDTLLNYINAVEQQLAVGQPAGGSAPPAKATGGQ